MAKFYVDEEGNRFSVNRETGEKTLIQPAESENGEVSDPAPADVQED